MALNTGAMLYGTPCWFLQGVAVPVIGPGTAGNLEMDNVRAALVPQVLVAVTDKVKAVVPVVKDAVIALVP